MSFKSSESPFNSAPRLFETAVPTSQSPSLAAWLLERIFWLYQACVSPFLPSACRFWPRCSDFGRVAIHRYGAVWGSWLTFKRICRCHPGNPGGMDPVP